MAKSEIVALGEGMKILEDAKKAGMRVAGKILEKGSRKGTKKVSWNVADDEMKKMLMDGFLEFKKTAAKSEMFQEKVALRYFLDGFAEAYEPDL